MGGIPVKRKLAAIFAADAVGYSRLMAADEEKTLKVLSAHRAVIDGIIEFHEGRIVGTAGDSVLAEFGSPVEAVRCAVEVQDALKTRNDSLPENERMQFRIGVNLGDVIAKGDDLLGDGVNIAARLEGIAEPGGICVSSSVYDQIAGKLDLGFVDIGTQTLKNIQRPIQVYRIERQGQRAAAPAPGWTRGLWVAGALALTAIAAALAWYVGRAPGVRVPERAEVKDARPPAQAEVKDARPPARAKAKRAPEEQRAAKNRARAPTQASPAVLPRRYDGQWAAEFSCRAFAGRPAFTSNVQFSVTDNTFSVQHGQSGKPGSFQVSGSPQPDGRLQLVGDGLVATNNKRKPPQPYRAAFDAKYEAGHFAGTGQLGAQECRLKMSRAP